MLTVLKLRTKVHNWGLNKRPTNQLKLVYRLLGSGGLLNGDPTFTKSKVLLKVVAYLVQGWGTDRHNIKTPLLIISSWPEAMQFEAMWPPHLYEHDHSRLRRSGFMLTDLFSPRILNAVKTLRRNIFQKDKRWINLPIQEISENQFSPFSNFLIQPK